MSNVELNVFGDELFLYWIAVGSNPKYLPSPVVSSHESIAVPPPKPYGDARFLSFEVTLFGFLFRIDLVHASHICRTSHVMFSKRNQFPSKRHISRTYRLGRWRLQKWLRRVLRYLGNLFECWLSKTKRSFAPIIRCTIIRKTAKKFVLYMLKKLTLYIYLYVCVMLYRQLNIACDRWPIFIKWLQLKLGQKIKVKLGVWLCVDLNDSRKNRFQ